MLEHTLYFFKEKLGGGGCSNPQTSLSFIHLEIKLTVLSIHNKPKRPWKPMKVHEAALETSITNIYLSDTFKFSLEEMENTQEVVETVLQETEKHV